jgi:hypothetical protein
VGGQRNAPAALPPGKSRYKFYTRLGVPQGRSEQMRKIWPSPGFDPRSRYTDWATAHICNRNIRRIFAVVCPTVMFVPAGPCHWSAIWVWRSGLIFSLHWRDTCWKSNFIFIPLVMIHSLWPLSTRNRKQAMYTVLITKNLISCRNKAMALHNKYRAIQILSTTRNWRQH